MGFKKKNYIEKINKITFTYLLQEFFNEFFVVVVMVTRHLLTSSYTEHALCYHNNRFTHSLCNGIFS